MASSNRCPSLELPADADGFVELSHPDELAVDFIPCERTLPQDNDSRTAAEDNVATAKADAPTAASSKTLPETVDVSELQRMLLDMKQQMKMRDNRIDIMMTKLNYLALKKPNANECCCQSLTRDDCHLMPGISQELPYFEGIETQGVAHEWISKLNEIKRRKHWSDELTLEVATYYLLGEALTWAEAIDAVSWRQFEDKFMKHYVFKDQSEQVTFEKIGKFFGFRYAHTMEMSQRNVIIELDGKIEPVNMFHKFMDRQDTEEKRNAELKAGPRSNVVVNERMSMYLLIRSPVLKMREVSERKLKSTVRQLQNRARRMPPSYFYVPESEIVSRGPCSDRPKDVTESLMDDICKPGKRTSWSEWWVHLCLEDRITSKKPGLLNSKPIIVNKQSMKALVDLGAEHCTIQYTAAVNKRLDIASAAKCVAVYNDDGKSMIKSLGYVNARLCIQPFSLHGKAKLWVVPDGSQPEEVIIGESILYNPIIYRDGEVETQELPGWADFEDHVFYDTIQLREKDNYN